MKQSKKIAGFSIIELIVSIGVISIVSVIVFTGYRQIGRESLLESQANLIASKIELARGAAISASDIRDLSDVPVSVFSISFYEDEVILFEDTDSERKHKLEGEIVISFNGSAPNGEKIEFIPPDPNVDFIDNNGNQIEKDYFEVVIRYKEEVSGITIRTNVVGLVELGMDF